MTLRLQALVLGAVLGLLAACTATTTFDSIWKAPNVKSVSPVGKTVVAVFVSRDISQRRAAEDEMVKDLNKRGAHGIAAYTLLPNDKGADADAARAVFKAEGANAVVVMRLVGKDQKVTYTPGSPAPAWNGRRGTATGCCALKPFTSRSLGTVPTASSHPVGTSPRAGIGMTSQSSTLGSA